MDRLTLLENNLAFLLASIDGTFQSSGYQYYTVTGQVDVDGDVLATSKNIVSSDINHTVEMLDQPEENNEWGLAQNIYTNTIYYTITSQLKLDGDETLPRRSAEVKCNELLSDIKYALGADHTLQRQCNWIKYVRSFRDFSTDGNLINAVQLRTIVELNYSQSLKNPNIVAC